MTEDRREGADFVVCNQAVAGFDLADDVLFHDYALGLHFGGKGRLGPSSRRPKTTDAISTDILPAVVVELLHA